MAYATILVCATSDRDLPNLIALAGAIAVPQRSHVTGIAVLPRQILLPAGTPGKPDTIAIDAHRKAVSAEVERMGQTFARATAGQPFAAEWRVEDAASDGHFEAILRHGRLAEIIIASDSQPGPTGAPSFSLAERLVIEAGRPILLSPRKVPHSTCGRRVLIGWNGSREATRAVFDVLPLLVRAEHVKVLQVRADEPVDGARASGDVLCAALRRHGVMATSEDLALPRASAGAALLSAVKAENADLLVMGGYGHWRFQELVLGGATRHVLRNMTVPVFMSH
jgi:nucleotide-binding universal stress UspA family protein